MTNKLRLLTTSLLTASLLLTSCAEVSKVLEDPALMSQIGAVGGALVGSQVGNSPRQRQQNMVIGAAGGAGAGWLASKAYSATVNQRRYAQEKANYALTNNRSVMRSVKANNARYVAVPVKADKGGSKSKSGIVRVKVKEKSDGTLEAVGTDSKIYDSVPGKSGSQVKVGGEDAVYYYP